MRIFGIVMALAACVARADVEPDDIRGLLDAIATVETGSPCQPGEIRGIVGDDGRSLGPYQISKAYYKDARVPGPYGRVVETEFAERVVIAYMRRYFPRELERAARGDLSAMEVLARAHNGGPNGPRRKATQGYWTKVKRCMEEST